jgi:hypothetical protein
MGGHAQQPCLELPYYSLAEVPFGFVILSRSEGSLVPEAEILHVACGLVQDDNWQCFSADTHLSAGQANPFD